MKRILTAVLIISLLLCIGIYAENADFTMTGSTLNVKASDILQYGEHTFDSAKFARDNRVVSANADGGAKYEGQFFNHSGSGDTFTFTVDFQNHNADSLTFLYGGGACKTTIAVYSDGVEIGRATAPESFYISGDGYSQAPVCEIRLSPAQNGLKTIKLEVCGDSKVWPGSDYGYFVFRGEGETETKAPETSAPEVKPDTAIKMTGKVTTVYASDILAVENSLTRDASAFQTGFSVDCNSAPNQPEYDKAFFIHSGAGDRFTFYMDFTEFSASAFGYMSYGAGSEPTVFELYADGVLLGGGEAKSSGEWEPVDYSILSYDEFNFSNALTGIVKIEIVIKSSNPRWPANNLGYYTFYSDKDTYITGSAVETGDDSTFEITDTSAVRTTASDTEPTASDTGSDTSGGNRTGTEQVNTVIYVTIALGTIAIVGAVILTVRKAGKQK